MIPTIHPPPSIAATPPRLKLPRVERVKLGSGLEVLLSLQDRVPLMALQLVFPAGARYEPSGFAGLAALTTSLLRAGGRTQPSTLAAEPAASLGTEILAGTDWDAAVLMIDLLAEDLGFGVDLLAERAWAPSFSEAACAQALKTRIHALRQRRLHPQPSTVADAHFVDRVYQGTVYARSQLGDEGSLARVDRDDIICFHSRHFAARGASLLVVGSFRFDVLLARVEAAFPAVGGKDPPAPPPVLAPARTSSQILLVDLPRAEQVEIRLGHSSIGRTHLDFDNLNLLNTLLGGTSSSRIPLNLRERHGYTYAVRSRLDAKREIGALVVETALGVDNTVAALAEIIQEVDRLRQEPVSAAELVKTQTYLAGVLPRTFETNYDILRWLKQSVVDRLPAHDLDDHLNWLWELDPPQLLDLAQRHLNPEGLTIIVAGPARELQAPMAQLGYPVTVLPGNPLRDSRP